MQTTTNRRKAAIKAVILLAFIVTAFLVVRFTPVKEYLRAETLSRLFEAAGFWAPVAYIVIYAAGICLFVPGTLLTALGAAIFGPYLGFLYVWPGAVIGSSLSFLIGRYLGRDFAASLIGDKLKKYDDAIEKRLCNRTLPAPCIFPVYPPELRNGPDQSPFQGLRCRNGPGDYRRCLHLHVLHRDR